MKVTCRPTIEHRNVCHADRILYCLHDRLKQQRHFKCWWEDRKIIKFKGPTGLTVAPWGTSWGFVKDGHAKIEYIEGIPCLCIEYRFRWKIHLLFLSLLAGMYPLATYILGEEGVYVGILCWVSAMIILGTLANYYGTASRVRYIGGKSIQDAAVGGHIKKKDGIFQRIRDWFRL